MRPRVPDDRAAGGDGPAAANSAERYVFELYVAETMPHSVRAVREIKRLCEQRLRGRYALKVLDLSRQPRLAAERQILALPTLIKVEPAPVRRIIGDLSDARRVTAALGLPAPEED